MEISGDPKLVSRPDNRTDPPVKFVSSTRPSMFAAAIALTSMVLSGAAHASSPTEAAVLIEADTGKVLYAENAGVPWYPASLSKLMTTYVTLQAVKNKRITLDR